MEINTKKVLYLGYVMILAINFVFRDVAFTYTEFLYTTFVLISAISLILRYLTRKDRGYKFPQYVIFVGGVLFAILGLTQFTDSLLGGLTFIVGIWFVVSSIAIYLLGPTVNRYLFDEKINGKRNTRMVIDFILFFMYFTLVSRDITAGYNTIELEILNILLLVLAFNIIYFIAQFLIKKFLSKLRFDMLYSMIAGMIVLSLYTGIWTVSSDFIVQSNIFYLSFSLFVSINLIIDIFKTINE